jgi:hypothetical protein
MVIHVYLNDNSNKIVETSVNIGGWCSQLVTMRGNIFRVQGRLPNMVIDPKIPRKSDKNRNGVWVLYSRSQATSK